MKIALYKMHLSGLVIVLEYDDSLDSKIDMVRVSEIEHIDFIMRADLEDADKALRLKFAQVAFDQAKAQLEALKNDNV